ncbi:hypothetical protein ACTA71_004188 [Dictyostelium dimigraforme]
MCQHLILGDTLYWVKSQDQSPITLIVNPNNNNTYIIGEKCGIETFTCNSISDAVAYFNSIAVLVDNGTIYQQLNLKLSNGTYGIRESSVNLFQFNCTISPLDIGGDIIFNGFLNPLNYNDTMIDIRGPQQQSTKTSVLFSGLNFISFNHSIIIVVSIDTFTNVTFDQCNFNGYQAQPNVHMIEFSRIDPPINPTLTSLLIISNSIIINSINSNPSSLSNSDLIAVVGLNVTLYNVYINSINHSPQSVLKVDTAYANITNCQFSNVNTSIGAIFSIGSNVTLFNSTFYGLSAVSGPGLFNHIPNIGLNSSFTMYSCSVSNCYSPTSAGVISLSNPFNLVLPISDIMYCSFNYNNGSSGGVLNSLNVPVNFYNCIFNSNVAVIGNIAQVFQTSLTVSYSSIMGSNSTTTTNVFAGTFVSTNSNLLFLYNVFGKQYTSFQCVSSTIIIENSKNLNPYYSCLNCKQLSVDTNSICQQSSTTSTLNFDSSDSFKLIQNFSTFTLILSLLIVSFNYLII